LERKGKKIKNPWGNFSLKGFYRSTGIRASVFGSYWWLLCCIEISFSFSCEKPLGKIFSQGVLSLHYHLEIHKAGNIWSCCLPCGLVETSLERKKREENTSLNP